MGKEKPYELLRDSVVNFRLRTCCFIAPLRAGILCLAYLNLIVSILLIVGTASSTFPTMATRVRVAINAEDPDDEASEEAPEEEAIPAAYLASGILPAVADLVFSVVLICALHRKDLRLLRIYCWYGIIAVGASILAYGLIITNPKVDKLYYVIIIISFVYQAYIVILVRSVMVDIRLAKATVKNELYYDTHKADMEKADEIVDKDKQETIINEVIETIEPSASKSSTLRVDASTNTTIEPTSWRTYTPVYKPILTPASVYVYTHKDPGNDEKTEIDIKAKKEEDNKEGDVKVEIDVDKVNKAEDTPSDEKSTLPEANEEVKSLSEVKEAPLKKKRGIFMKAPKEDKKKNDL